MPLEVGNLGHVGVLPHCQLVVGEPMTRHQLSVFRVPQKRRDLRSNVYALQEVPCAGVPELDAPVAAASPCRESV